jgi:hypothetical protein
MLNTRFYEFIDKINLEDRCFCLDCKNIINNFKKMVDSIYITINEEYERKEQMKKEYGLKR